MEVVRSAARMRQWADDAIATGERIVLVPTMGYLHAGHLALVEAARSRGARIVASIFVNPTQFGAGEDLARYPRDEAGDLEKLRGLGVAVAFVPSREEIYPDGFNTYVVPDVMADGLCGASRPGHFRGVCTVVSVLFRLTRCSAAVFGEKDFQQLQIIRRMARDLWMDVEVLGVPTVREADGLAMSSRNAYLNNGQRTQALGLKRSIDRVVAAAGEGEGSAEALLKVARSVLADAGLRLDYAEIVDAESLRPLQTVEGPALYAVAAYAGETRLIDNVRLGPGYV